MKAGSIWVSECGQYVARYIGTDVLDVVVYAIDGSARWVHAAPKPGECCSAPRLVASWSNQGRRLRSGRWMAAFSLTFVDVDMSVPVIAYRGNAVIRSYRAEFRRRLRWMPRALRHAEDTMRLVEAVTRD